MERVSELISPPNTTDPQPQTFVQVNVSVVVCGENAYLGRRIQKSTEFNSDPHTPNNTLYNLACVNVCVIFHGENIMYVGGKLDRLEE